jgi:polyamine oxidase
MIAKHDQQALANQSVTDFLILEYQDDIGGRMHNTKFGADSKGDPYTLELGANWVSGLGENTNGPENPVWTFAKQANLTTPYSDTTNVTTYTENGAVDFTDIIDEFEEYYGIFEQIAGTILSENLQDRSIRAGLRQSGWKPKDAIRKAVEYWYIDWDAAQVGLHASPTSGMLTPSPHRHLKQ